MATTSARKLSRRRRAVTPREIGVRLHTLSRKLDRRVAKGEGLVVEDVRYLAKKLRSYAARLSAETPVVSLAASRPRRENSAATRHTGYAFECSLGTWKILPMPNGGFVLFLDETQLDEYPTAEKAASDVRKKATGHALWDASREKAPGGVHEWRRFERVEEKQSGLSLVANPAASG
jgi:hypothetical protein